MGMVILTDETENQKFLKLTLSGLIVSELLVISSFILYTLLQSLGISSLFTLMSVLGCFGILIYGLWSLLGLIIEIIAGVCGFFTIKTTTELNTESTCEGEIP
jgi:lipid-A-disaccharide synthase-like uncharacterized protein